ncbi:hypothetical protein GW721_00025 [Citrobacter braakii]|nr:hypothetical protein [Citrobacter braakii]
MIIINSAAFVNDDLRAEFGLLPPCFLPLGNKRLYSYQIESLRRAFPEETIVISLPKEYDLGRYDTRFFKEQNITIIQTPFRLTQGESLYKILKNITLKANERLIINYGDTLFNDIQDNGDDYFYVSKNVGYYNRAPVRVDNFSFKIEKNYPAVDDGELVISGFFCISNVSLLLQYLLGLNFDFLSAIELYYSKVFAKVIIPNTWHDFGHLNSFFTSRTNITTEREFNTLLINADCVKKKSKKKQKMLGEANWFKKLPSELSIYTPRIFNVKEDVLYAEYTIEYLYNLPLSDMAVFCELPKSCWINVFNSCKDFLMRSLDFSSQNRVVEDVDLDEYNGLYLDKTLQRLHDFEKTTNISLHKATFFNGVCYPSILELASITAKYINPTNNDDVIVCHGDFCFSNILYDFRMQRIKLIDPRGVNSKNELSIWGDLRYDLAKLNHSVCGLYDLIIAGQFSIKYDYENNVIDFELYDENYKHVIDAYNKIFSNPQVFGYSSLEITCITIHLFLSMLPLHSDSKVRQEAFIANAYRLFSQLNMENV